MAGVQCINCFGSQPNDPCHSNWRPAESRRFDLTNFFQIFKLSGVTVRSMTVLNLTMVRILTSTYSLNT